MPHLQTATPNRSEFRQVIQQEFCQGSAIAPELFEATIAIESDLKLLPGGEVATPIHDALNWGYTRFGRQVRSFSSVAALLLNEDGSCWQLKLAQPRRDAKGKIQKYETPVGNGSRAFLPAIPTSLRQRIADRYNLDVPRSGSFWEWLASHPEVPIVFTEGGKKALALLSLGYVAIALYGVNGGYRNVAGERFLIADLQPFTTPERSITLAFDQDAKIETQHRVNAAISRLGGLLIADGCAVAIATWDGHDGKGVDDLIVNRGAEAWGRSTAEALSWVHWRIWLRLQSRLTYPTAIQVQLADLTALNLSQIPQQGIIAIDSGKGTGKTKLMGKLVAQVDKVLAGGHRVSLMRNLSERLGLNYRGDLDRVQGRFITGAGYTLRIGLCVDSLLAIDPTQFHGCDLILDEVVQVIRHLLTSTTCARDGKRPALLARLHALIQVARRVIVADADLDSATLHYLQALRGEAIPVFLIRNTYQSGGYPVRFLQCPDRSVITAQMLDNLQTLAPSQALFIATDSKSTSKAIARLIAQTCPDKRVLLINSETSGGEAEREFIQTPDRVLERQAYDVMICSPSVATGVSIEAQDRIERVYAIFTGASSTDADMSQALGRVRAPVERVVWCATTGSNYAKASRSTHPIEVKDHLQQQTQATIQLIRSNLREDIVSAVNDYDWQTNPHLNLYCRLAAAQNFAMQNLRDALLMRLRFEGNSVTIEEHDSNPTLKLLLRQTKQLVQQQEAEAIVAASDLTYTEVTALEQQESLTQDESRAIAKFHLKDFYSLDQLTVEDVLWDQEGRRRGELLNLEAQLFPDLASDRTVRALEKQAAWNQGYCPWDIAQTDLRRMVRHQLDLDELIAKMRSGWEWTQYDLLACAEKARQFAPAVKAALHFTITPKMSPVQIVHQLLSQLGIKFEHGWSRSVPGHEGEKLRVHQLDQASWSQLWAVIERREVKRSQFTSETASDAGGDEASGSPAGSIIQHLAGDPSQLPLKSPDQQWFEPRTLADVQAMWARADGDAESIAYLQQLVPESVLRRLRLIA